MPRPFSETADLAKQITWEVIGNDMSLGTAIQKTQTSEGEDAIFITVIFPDSRAAEVRGDQLIEIMGRIKSELPTIGEERVPLVSFARMEDRDEIERDRSRASA